MSDEDARCPDRERIMIKADTTEIQGAPEAENTP